MIPLSENPPVRFPERNISTAEFPWWVAKVKPRQEKALAFDCIQKQIEYYLPLYTKVTRRRDNNKPRKSIMVLFPGYISFSCAPGKEHSLYATNRVVNIIPVRSQKRFVSELEQIYNMLELGVLLEPFSASEFVPGLAVQVKTGPMRGVVGTVVKVVSGQKLVLKVDLLGMAAVKIDASQVEPISQPQEV